MVKHVESADEFNALKKASKPVRNPLSFRSFFRFEDYYYSWLCRFWALREDTNALFESVHF